MSFDIKITDNTDEILRELQERIEIGLEEIGVVAEADAVINIESSPRRVDTGFLRNSITHAISGESPAKSSYHSDDGSKSGSYSGAAPDEGDKSVYIGTNVEYAGYVHDGTSLMAPNRFLAKAAESKSEFVQIMEKALKG